MSSRLSATPACLEVGSSAEGARVRGVRGSSATCCEGEGDRSEVSHRAFALCPQCSTVVQ
eukprot:834275-Prorocentrum_minimum.AAC.1